MRVVVHHPARTEADGTAVPESVAAFRLGRIEDLTDPLTGETVPKDKVAERLLEAAQAEHPDCEVKLEHLHDNGDGTSEWKPEPPEQAAQAGEQHAQDLSATQGTEVQS